MRSTLFTRPIVAFIGLFAGLAIGICLAELADQERINYWSRTAAQNATELQQSYTENQKLRDQLKELGARLNESQPAQTPLHHQSKTTAQP